MPSYEPDKWNTDTLKKLNNCYNYATNKKNEPPPAGGKPPKPAEPGKSKKISAAQFKKIIIHGNQAIALFDYECLGLKTAAKADGLKDPNNNNQCNANCWLVAYYVRRLDEKKRLHGDYHFVRQDGPNKWSHKTGDGAVTDQKFNPKTGKFDGGPITDPRNDSVGLHYIFCGYLCVCPNKVSVAFVPPQDSVTEDTSVAVTLGATMGMTLSYPSSLTAVQVEDEVEAAAERVGGEWVDGVGAGAMLYRIDVLDEDRESGSTIFVADGSLTVWRDTPRHLPDPNGHALAYFGTRLGFTEPGFGGPWGDELSAQSQEKVVCVAGGVPDEHAKLNDRLKAWAALIAAVAIPVAIVLLGILLS
jgi:hypothetical protein